jgi:8-oxo-dGTP pyrophosphatase MutT (NUDIX family)
MNKLCFTSVRAIIKRGDKILLAQRSNKTKNGGYWEFPGGKVECRDPKKAVKREVKEEIGLNFKPKLVKESKVGKYFVRYYNGKASGKIKMQKSEIQGIGWFTKNQARKLNLVKHTRRLI